MAGLPLSALGPDTDWQPAAMANAVAHRKDLIGLRITKDPQRARRVLAVHCTGGVARDAGIALLNFRSLVNGSRTVPPNPEAAGGAGRRPEDRLGPSRPRVPEAWWEQAAC